jgi:hypothetical protein
LKEFAGVFEKTPGLPPKRDIYFYIDLMLGFIGISNNTYIMSMP